VWGDSITVPVVPNLQVLVPSRTVFDGSGIAQTSAQVAGRALNNANTRSWIAVVWCGHNNFQLGGIGNVVSDIASVVNGLGPSNGNRFVICSMLNAATPEGIRGGSQYSVVLQINSQLQAAYPNNYLDLRSALVARYNPAIPQDVQDHNDDVVPSSLRYDEIHFRQEGSAFAASLIRDFVAAHGW
jgi:hypothetical protein